MLLCIEMAGFAIMHIWAFSHKPYLLGSTQNAGDPNAYYRGFMRAMLDALNPWDIVKALARSMRWLFVGYRHREQDESYGMKAPSADDSFSYHAPAYSANGGSAGELGGQGKGGNGRPYDDHDSTALLAHAQADPGALHPAYRPGNSYEDGGDLSMATTNVSRDDYYGTSYPPQAGAFGRDNSPYRYDAEVKPAPAAMPQQAAHPFAGATTEGHVPSPVYDDLDTGYHAAANAPSSRMPQAHEQQWNFFGGADAPR